MMFAVKPLVLSWTIAVAVMTVLQAACAGENNVGVRHMPAASEDRGTDLDLTVWYPASPGGKSVALGDSMLFEGTPARLDAPVAPGRFPLVLLSHGAGLAGNPQALSWIAVPLAKQGFVVAAPAHPGNTGPHRSAAETMKLWLRPADLTDTLDAIATDPVFKEHLAPSQVGALGLSMGGNTVLMIAGARLDPPRLAGYCDTDALNPSLCGWVRHSGVDLHALNFQAAGRGKQDQRIRFVMAIDPAPVDVFWTESFSEISVPVEIVNLGRPDDIPVTAQASGIARMIPNVRYSVIEDASHYSMFAECKSGAAEIATADKIEDPICSDGGRRSRHDIHAQLIDMVTAAFNRTMKADR